ncbi:MAG: ATP synthase F0 subunit B [Nannocystaceae bacterium]
MEIDWKTVAFELINFVVLMLLLGRFLFTPARAVMARRRDEIEAARREAEGARREAEGARVEFEARRREVEAAAERAIDAARAQASAAGEAIVADAREEAEGLRVAARAEIDEARARAVAALGPRIAGLAAEAAGRLLAAARAPTLARIYLDEAAEALARGLGGARPSVRAWLSPDVDEAALRAALRRALGAEPVLEVRRDPTLVAGARLEAGAVEVRASASETLDAWLKGQVSDAPGEAA